MIKLDYTQSIHIDLEKLIKACDESDLNELILLANKKLDKITHWNDFHNTEDNKPTEVLENTKSIELE